MTASINLYNSPNPAKAELILAELWAESVRKEQRRVNRENWSAAPQKHSGKPTGRRAQILKLLSDGKGRTLREMAKDLKEPNLASLHSAIKRAADAGVLNYHSAAQTLDTFQPEEYPCDH